jgi:PAS domain S-box-containing protein
MFRNVSIKARLIGVMAFLSMQLIVGGIISIVSLGHTHDSIQSMYDDRLVCVGLLDTIIRGIMRNDSAIAKAVMSEQPAVAKIVNGVNDQIAAIDKAWDPYMATDLTPGEKKLANEFAEARQKFLAEGVIPALAALQAGDTQGANRITQGPLTTLLEPVRARGDALIKLQLDVAKSQYEQSQRLYRLVRNTCIAVSLLGIMLAAVVGWWLVQAITKPLDKAVRVATSLAEGSLTDKIEVHSNDETGRLMQALKNLRNSMIQKAKMARLGSWRLDLDTQAMTWSTETARLFGMEQVPEAPAFSDFLQRIHEDDRQRIQQGLERTIATGEEFTAECRIQRLDGSLRWVQMAARRSHNDGKRVLRGIFINITERKQALESLTHSQGLLRELTAHQDRLKEDDRRRIAREIHDELGQTLLALRLDVSTLATRTAQAHPRLNQRVRDVLQQLDATVKSVRSIINNLRPAVLDLGLAAAIEWQVNEFRRRSGIACELVLDADECVLDDLRATTLFRILQESLTNVIRHAKATHVLVELRQEGDRLAMRITDNGIGIGTADEARYTTDTFGLVGMRERIHALNGEFQIASTSGRGTALTIYIPLAKMAEMSSMTSPFSVAS